MKEGGREVGQAHPEAKEDFVVHMTTATEAKWRKKRRKSTQSLMQAGTRSQTAHSHVPAGGGLPVLER